jgi:hypothetical protein
MNTDRMRLALAATTLTIAAVALTTAAPSPAASSLVAGQARRVISGESPANQPHLTASRYRPTPAWISTTNSSTRYSGHRDSLQTRSADA